MFLYSEGNSVVNTDNLCSCNLNDKKIEFYFTSMTARENWNFDSKEKASEQFKIILNQLGIS